MPAGLLMKGNSFSPNLQSFRCRVQYHYSGNISPPPKKNRLNNWTTNSQPQTTPGKLTTRYSEKGIFQRETHFTFYIRLGIRKVPFGVSSNVTFLSRASLGVTGDNLWKVTKHCQVINHYLRSASNKKNHCLVEGWTIFVHKGKGNSVT